MEWFRWYHGACSDAKWPIVARKAGVNVGVVVSVWAALLEHASQDEERGRVETFDCETFDALYGYEDGTCGRVFTALEEKGLIGGGFVGAKDPVEDTEGYWEKFGGEGLRRGGIAPYYRVAFGGSDGRRAIFWGETEADEAYILCDGGSDGQGGTVPDLRDRMILGAGPEHAAGSIGGSETHTHGLSGTVGATTLTEAQLASHSHTTSAQINDHLAASHNRLPYMLWTNYSGSAFSTQATGASTAHTHSLSGTINSASNLSPFYALAYVVYAG